MDLKQHLSTLAMTERTALAESCKTTAGHLQNIAYGFRIPSAELCVLLEQNTAGVLSRQELLPEKWQDIWPELAPNPPSNKPSPSLQEH